MNLPKSILILTLTVWGTFPLSAQSVKKPSETKEGSPTQQTQVVSQNQSFHQNCYCDREPLTTQELIEAEEELMQIRNSDINATFENYPYLLNPVYRRNKGNHACSCRAHHTQETPATTNQNTYVDEEAPLDTRELIEAEEELALIRNTQDNHATFEKYPYLLEIAYRRGDEQKRQQIRQDFEKEKRKLQSTWARKIGL